MAEQYTLTQLDKDIISTKDPDQFIDMLNLDSYTRGDAGGKIPVDRHRILFDEWLKQHDAEVQLDELRPFTDVRITQVATVREFARQRIVDITRAKAGNNE